MQGTDHIAGITLPLLPHCITSCRQDTPTLMCDSYIRFGFSTPTPSPATPTRTNKRKPKYHSATRQNGKLAPGQIFVHNDMQRTDRITGITLPHCITSCRQDTPTPIRDSYSRFGLSTPTPSQTTPIHAPTKENQNTILLRGRMGNLPLGKYMCTMTSKEQTTFHCCHSA